MRYETGREIVVTDAEGLVVAVFPTEVRGMQAPESHPEVVRAVAWAVANGDAEGEYTGRTGNGTVWMGTKYEIGPVSSLIPVGEYI